MADNKPTQHTSKRLTGKQKAFIQHIIDNPTLPLKAAAKAAYGKPGKPISDRTAEVMASENLRKPEIMSQLAKYSESAENVMIEVMNYSNEYGKQGGHVGAAYATTARQTAQDILDRLHGKATQKTQTESVVVTLNVDLSGTS